MYLYIRDTIINSIIHNYINCRYKNIVANIADPFVGTIKWCVTFYSCADEYQWKFCKLHPKWRSTETHAKKKKKNNKNK